MGSRKSSKAVRPPPDYAGAMQLVANRLAGAWQGQDPRIQAVLMLQTAFDDFNGLTVGRQLDEETMTAAFLGHLASSARHTDWLSSAAGASIDHEPLRWLHYSKRAESAVGADFALFIPVLSNTQHYRLVVCQAKKEGGDAIDVARSGSWLKGSSARDDAETGKAFRERRETDSENARDVADRTLRWVRTRFDSPQVLDLSELTWWKTVKELPQWQLTKLLMHALQLRAISVEPGAIDVCYAIWPNEQGKVPQYAPLSATQLAPTARDGDDAARQKAQSIPVSALQNDLRRLLMEAVINESNGGLTLDQAANAFELIVPDTGAVAILSLGAPGPALVLESHLRAKFEALVPPQPALAPLSPPRLNTPSLTYQPK